MVKNMRVAVVDDEQESIDTLIKLLALCQDVDVVYESTSPIDALSFLNEHQVDLLITDVVMSDIDGISLVGSLSNPPPIILMTSYSERAIEGFDIGALHCLTKPVNIVRLKQAIQRVRERNYSRPYRNSIVIETTERDHPENTYRKTYARRFLLSDMVFINTDGNLAHIHQIDGIVHTARITLNELESRLPSPPFIRVHKGFLIHMDHIDKVSFKQRRSHLFMRGETTAITIDPSKAEHIKKYYFNDLPGR